MNVQRGVLAAAAAWLVVVVLGSTLAWAVISRAGEEVGDPSEPATGAVPVVTRTAPTHKLTRTNTTEPTTSGTSAEPTTTGTTAPPATSATSASPVRRTRTWQGLGGLVVVECRGGVIRLVGAQADSGFHVEVDDRGPERVEVEFEGQGDREGAETRVRAYCRGGTPFFDVESDDS